MTGIHTKNIPIRLQNWLDHLNLKNLSKTWEPVFISLEIPLIQVLIELLPQCHTTVISVHVTVKVILG